MIPLTDSPAPAGVPTPNARPTALILLLLFIAGACWLTLRSQSPPRALPADSPPEVFSAGRAMKHLEVISRAPHPPGTDEHAAVRDYIVGQLTVLGLEPEVQTATVAAAVNSGLVHAATVRNVVARAKGTASGRAVLLVAHYDSVANSRGASDDGSGVVALLETARALAAGPPPKNDLVYLFTDAEESLLLGARAFADEHPLAKDVGVVLNFEARGSGGPSLLFETSDRNGRLVREFAAAAPHPHASSLFYELYKLLPYDTDFTVFKEQGLPGLNFAYIDGAPRYHTYADSLENVDPRSIQHHGSYALTLARGFGSAGLPLSGEGNRIYFDVLGLGLLHYPAWLALPLAALTAVLFAAVTWFGARRGRVEGAEVAQGLGLFGVALLVAPVLAALIWWVASAVQQNSGRSLQDDLYKDKLYLAAFVALSLALVTTLYGVVRNRLGAESLALGALLWWLVLLLLVSAFIPGGSYLLTWPLLAALAGMAFVFFSEGGRTGSVAGVLVLLLCALPGIVLVVPLIYHVFVGLGPSAGGVAAALAVLLCGLFVPHLALLPHAGRWLLPGVAALAGVVFLSLALFSFQFDRRHPKADHILYALNADSGKAVWASTDAAPDEWTRQFFNGPVERGSLKEYLPTATSVYMKSAAPAQALEPPELKLLSDSTAGDVRTLRLSLTASKEYGVLTLFVDKPGEVLAATAGGKRVENRVGGRRPAVPWRLQYWALPREGVELTLEVTASQPLKVAVTGRSYKFPDTAGAPLRPRPDDTMPKPFQVGDSSLVTKTYTF